MQDTHARWVTNAHASKRPCTCNQMPGCSFCPAQAPHLIEGPPKPGVYTVEQLQADGLSGYYRKAEVTHAEG